MPRAPKDPIDAVTHPNPYPYYAALRDAAPVHWFAERNIWAAVSAQAVVAAFEAPCAKVRPPSEPVPAFLQGTRAGDVFGALARMNDGEAHQRQRARVMQLMGRLSSETLATGAARAIVSASSRWIERRSGASMDELIRRMPVASIVSALGFPDDAHEPMLASTAAWVAGLSPSATDGQRQAAIAAMDRLLTMIPADGIEEAAACVAVLMQPHEATAGLIGAGLLRLAQDARLRDAAIDGVLPWDRFGAEVLRHDPPIQNTRRTLAADATIAGTPIRAGDTMLLVLAAAARDPVLHEAPDEFRLDRPSRAELPLGAGAHACPGGPAALAIAACTWRHVVAHASTSDWEALARGVSWQASVNARIPAFGQQP
jgi:cytochrome P450